tara:strand:+ start:884 stop:1288 length:405 start_codon:yes stop_codon:yes gene_type:complete
MLAFSSCASIGKVELVICPSELKEAFNEKKDRVALSYSDYLALIIAESSEGIVPVQHYRPEQTFTHRLHQQVVTWEKPLHISTLMIFDNPKGKAGVAVRRKTDAKWRVFWFSKEDLRSDVIYLPPYKDLEILGK